MLGGISLFDPLLRIGPLLLIGLILIALCLGARELGVLLYSLNSKRRAASGKSGIDNQSHVVTAIFGLLAFIIGFTFAMAADRYDTRRVNVIDESNAIGTTYLRASLFDEPAASQMRATLREYARSRISPNGVFDTQMQDDVARSAVIRDKFWNEVLDAVRPIRGNVQASYFLQTANEMIDSAARREATARAHVPLRILDVTLVYLLISAGLLGYLMAAKDGRRTPSTLVLILFVIVVTLVLDLDQPQTGTVRVPQSPMEELVAQMDRDAALESAAAASQASAPSP